MEPLNAESLKNSITTNASAVRLRLKLEPIGGVGDKIFPPTYEGSTYAVEQRLVDGRAVQSVLLNSVQSEAARMEQALKRGLERGEIYFPTVKLELDGHPSLLELDLPHRIFDGYLVNSTVGKDNFWDSPAGKEIHGYRQPEATGLYRHSPRRFFSADGTHTIQTRSWRTNSAFRGRLCQRLSGAM